jgi:hypothetical protein
MSNNVRLTTVQKLELLAKWWTLIEPSIWTFSVLILCWNIGAVLDIWRFTASNITETRISTDFMTYMKSDIYVLKREKLNIFVLLFKCLHLFNLLVQCQNTHCPQNVK